MKTTRRGALAGALSIAALALAPARAYESKWPAKPSIPTDFNAEELFTELEQKGEGIVFEGEPGMPVVRMVFDTQCPWCLWQFRQYEPWLGKVTFVWYPVAVLSTWSEKQGAAILAAKDRKALFLEHEAHFKDAAFRGLDVRGRALDEKMIEALWTNTKIYRRAGGRDVPFGVAKLPDGRFAALPEEKREDFEKALGLK